MIYEWYSGSDRSGQVPEAIAEIDRVFEELGVEERLKRLAGILDRERDPNWRGCLRFRTAMNLKLAGRHDEAGAEFFRAIEEFDPLGGNIRDVMPQYTESLLRLIVDHLQLDTDAEVIAEYGSIIAANMNESMLDSLGTSLTWSYLSGALNRIGHERKLPICYRLALNFAIRAHHEEPDDPIFLEQLIYCYFNVRDREHCRLAYQMFGKVGPPKDLKSRVDEFMRARFQEIGGRLENPS